MDKIVTEQIEKYLDSLLRERPYPEEIKLNISDWFSSNDYDDNDLTSLLLYLSTELSKSIKGLSNVDETFNDLANYVLKIDEEVYIDFIKSHLENYEPPEDLKEYVNDFVNYLDKYMDTLKD